MKNGTIIIPTHKIERDRKYNILTLLEDLSKMDNIEQYNVLVVANGIIGNDLEELRHTIPWKENFWLNVNPNPIGLSSAWNTGIDFSNHWDGEYVFFLNHDVHFVGEDSDENVFDRMIREKEAFEVKSLLNVFIFGVEGTYQSPPTNVQMVARFQQGQFGATQAVSEVSGFLFGTTRSNIFHVRGLGYPFFDKKLNPCFYEEMDMYLLTNKLQETEVDNRWINIIIPFVPYEHEFGLSAEHPYSTKIQWTEEGTGRPMEAYLREISTKNKAYIETKWGVRLG